MDQSRVAERIADGAGVFGGPRLRTARAQGDDRCWRVWSDGAPTPRCRRSDALVAARARRAHDHTAGENASSAAMDRSRARDMGSHPGLAVALAFRSLAGVFAIWANLHGGWIVGLGVAGTWSLEQVLDTRDWRQIRPLGLLWTVCLLATLLTPYGTHLWGFVWNTVGMDRAITEWHPVWRQGDVGDAALWSLTALVSTALALRSRWSWSSMLPVLLLGGASFQVARLVGFFGLTTVLLLGARWRQGPAPRFPPLVLALATLGCAVAAGITVGPEARCLPITAAVIPDLVTPGALASPTVRGRLMVPFNWGQYAIWHFGPRLRCRWTGGGKPSTARRRWRNNSPWITAIRRS